MTARNQGTSAAEPQVVVAIASVGRPEILHETVAHLQEQSLPPAEIVLATPGPSDVLDETLALPNVRSVPTARGLTTQRNAVLGQLPAGGILAFFDDDVELDPRYLERMSRLFAADPGVVLATGLVLADGRKRGGITRDEARRALEAPVVAPEVRDESEAYGCNMVARVSALADVRFDERLPLYGWLEDLDFARTMMRRGRVVRFTGARAVHLGVPSGRQSEARFGFSQVMNPYYLWRKGQLSGRELLKLWAPVSKNVVRAVTGDELVDRPARLRGNLLAFRFVARSRVEPEHILRLR